VLLRLINHSIVPRLPPKLVIELNAARLVRLGLLY
jgi:hypothetical protein